VGVVAQGVVHEGVRQKFMRRGRVRGSAVCGVGDGTLGSLEKGLWWRIFVLFMILCLCSRAFSLSLSLSLLCLSWMQLYRRWYMVQQYCKKYWFVKYDVQLGRNT
jgi:hypothetical protein